VRDGKGDDCMAQTDNELAKEIMVALLNNTIVMSYIGSNISSEDGTRAGEYLGDIYKAIRKAIRESYKEVP
jgi:hypothetical protein